MEKGEIEFHSGKFEEKLTEFFFLKKLITVSGCMFDSSSIFVRESSLQCSLFKVLLSLLTKVFRENVGIIFATEAPPLIKVAN